MPKFTPQELSEIGYSLFQAAGCREEDAKAVVDHLVESNLFVDCTIAPGVAMFGTQAGAPYRNGQNQSYTFPMGIFKATGGYISIHADGAGEDSPWARLCVLMGREDLVENTEFRSDQDRLQRVQEVVEIVEG